MVVPGFDWSPDDEESLSKMKLFSHENDTVDLLAAMSTSESALRSPAVCIVSTL